MSEINLPTVETLESQLIIATLEKFNGSRKLSAESLGISIRGLRCKISKYLQQGYQVPASRNGPPKGKRK